MNIFNHNAVTLCVANEDQFSNLTNDWLSLFSTQALNLSEHIDAYYIDFNSENLPSVDDIRRGLSLYGRVLGYQLINIWCYIMCSICMRLWPMLY